MKQIGAMWLAIALQCAPILSLAQEPKKAAEGGPIEAADAERKSEEAALNSPPFSPVPKAASTASGLIYIMPGTGRSDASVTPLYALLQSHRVQQAAIKHVATKQLGNMPEDLKDVEIGVVGGTHTTNVVSYDDRLPADLVLEELKNQVASELLSLDSSKELTEQERTQSRVLELLQADLARDRELLFRLAKQNNVEVDPQIDSQRRLQLATERQRLQVELDGLKARQAILEKQIATMAETTLGKSAERIEAELARVVEARKQQIAHLREVQVRPGKAAGEAAAEKINAVTADLAQAEVELAKFRREALEEGSRRAQQLRHRLDDTLIEMAETEAKLASVVQIANWSPQVDARRLELELDELQLRRARQEHDEMVAKRLSYIPPHVVLIRTR